MGIRFWFYEQRRLEFEHKYWLIEFDRYFILYVQQNVSAAHNIYIKSLGYILFQYEYFALIKRTALGRLNNMNYM